jgi:hypothetical protein
MNTITKIQLALQAIGYMATRHNQIIEQIPMQESTQEMIIEHFNDQDQLLEDLNHICEEFGDLLNSQDMTNNVDEAVLNPIFSILHGALEEGEQEIKTNI